MKKLIAMLLALAMVLSLAACGAKQSNPTDAPTDAPVVTEAPTEATPETEAAPTTVVFTDDLGREVELPADITRIVSTGPLAQIVLYAIAPDMFVGLSAKWYDSAEGYIPEEYWNLPFFGQLYGSADLNVEELALAAPQVIIDIGEAKGNAVEDLNTLEEQTTIPAVFISATLETMPQTFRTLGELLGREEKGEELAQFCERVYNRTVSIMEQVGDNKVDALYVLGEQGLNVLAKDSYHAELIDMLTNNLAVVENPVGKGTGNEVTMEQIALWNPNFVLFAPDSIFETAAETDTWADINAIVNNNYIEVPEGPHNWMGSPPAVQRYLGLIWLTAELYPEYCDYDVKAEIYEYYELFYNCQLTEEQYAALTANAFLAD